MAPELLRRKSGSPTSPQVPAPQAWPLPPRRHTGAESQEEAAGGVLALDLTATALNSQLPSLFGLSV